MTACSGLGRERWRDAAEDLGEFGHLLCRYPLGQPLFPHQRGGGDRAVAHLRGQGAEIEGALLLAADAGVPLVLLGEWRRARGGGRARPGRAVGWGALRGPPPAPPPRR